ncbi:thioredoxin domain-containing protein [Anabrus simplex]|uniref:thioredoxin domain-containing protein n=1 Tax=Anabrus simplex TaxID=316456 RepID=UPI0034DCDEB4
MKNLMFVVFHVLVTSCLLSSVQCAVSAGLETVNDDELLNLVRSEKYVVVLFTKKDCEECDLYENELTHLREDLVDDLNAWVVKAHDSQLVRLYKPTKEPALVYFRHGIPLLYDGPLNDELILHTFNNNKEPAVRELSDDNFEHLTQASSGATTGDWFIMFYSTDCVECQRLQATWEAVGAKLKTRMNVARINKQTTGAVTGRRFGVSQVPSFIYFRQGKMYRYNIPRYDVGSFTAFVTDWYKNARMEIVPVPKSPFDDFTQMVADTLREYPVVWKAVSLFFFLVVAVYTVISKLKQKKQEPKKAKKSK